MTQNSDRTKEKMDELKENADKMQTIMGLISNVADQTGLLAWVERRVLQRETSQLVLVNVRVQYNLKSKWLR